MAARRAQKFKAACLRAARDRGPGFRKRVSSEREKKKSGKRGSVKVHEDKLGKGKDGEGVGESGSKLSRRGS